MIFSLVKMVKTEEYAKEFLKGNLYANSLKCFRDLEEGGNRADRQEGGLSFSDNFIVNMSDGNVPITITPDLVYELPMAFPNQTANLNVFCMFALHYDNPGELGIGDSSEYKITLPDACINDFGEYAVAITNVTKFQNRVLKAVKRENFLGRISRFRGACVEYRQPTVFLTPDQDDFMLAFRKGENFSDQREYRFVFQYTNPTGGPVRLNIAIYQISRYLRDRAKWSSVSEQSR